MYNTRNFKPRTSKPISGKIAPRVEKNQFRPGNAANNNGGNGGNDNQGTSKFDPSKYEGGPNPFVDKFNYDNPKFNKTNVDFSNKKHLKRCYDKHEKKCFGMTQNNNKESLREFQRRVENFIQSPNIEKINGSYRYECPTYLYKEKNGNLVTLVNATDNSYITSFNMTEKQKINLEQDYNIGLDRRTPLDDSCATMSFILRLRGPKNGL